MAASGKIEAPACGRNAIRDSGLKLTPAAQHRDEQTRRSHSAAEGGGSGDSGVSSVMRQD